jgi:hypothetical protein
MYRTLDTGKIVETISRLEKRIAERFPGSGLVKVCTELHRIAGENRGRLEQISRPHFGLRLASGAVLAAGLAALVWTGTLIVKLKADNTDLFGVMQGIEAMVNLLLVMGAGVFTLVTLEARWKRRQALEDLHELRSIVHVIDMHQLTKDPSTNPAITPPTVSSPERKLGPAELVRYLDYCSEMLSLTAKVAALYAQHSADALVIDTVNDIERLTSNLSSKIWQKINIVQAMVAAAPTTSVPVMGARTEANAGDEKRPGDGTVG